MPIFDVTQIRTVTIIHRIKAETEHDAIERMAHRSNKGTLIDILSDDSTVEYEAEIVTNRTKRR